MIDAILDPFALETSFKRSFPDELDRARMGLEMKFGYLEFFPSSGPVSATMIRNAMCQSGTPIDLNTMRSTTVQSAGQTFGLAGYHLPTTGPISFGDWRGLGVGCNP